MLDLSNWKLTLPVGTPSKPIEIKQPALATYVSEWFRPTGDGIVFIAPTDGVTTKNSRNPRCELREMSGAELAAWSTVSGFHSMEIEQSVDALPIGPKPVVVCGQIHDSDDVTVFRMEGNTVDRRRAALWITDGNNSRAHMLTDSYRLGDRFRVGFWVKDGVIRYSFNNQPVNYSLTKKTTGCYFKAGAYNQAGGIITRLPDGRADYAQVTIYSLSVSHESGAMTGNPDVTAQQIADLQRQVAALTTTVQRHEQRWAALGKAVQP